MTKVTLYSKFNCNLCYEMREILLRIKSEFDFIYEEVYIENDKAIYDEYKDKIPVLMIDGKIFAKYKVNEEKLRNKIRLCCKE